MKILTPVEITALETREAFGRDTMDFEVRLAVDDEGTFTGIAAPFDVRNSHNETIKRGAFTRTLQVNRNVPMLWSHDPSQPVGVWTSITEDDQGLTVTGRLIRETAKGAEAYALMKAGALSGLSIGFRAVHAERAAGTRVLTEISLVEISLVTLPSASGARITSVRNSPETGRASSAAAFVATCRKASRSLKGK